ncbi:DUF3846 domain-containing protein [uncultured Microbacterium sp.]|uniref:DUF3846 domain-containing protein n=1 Tax=uncultured Microbacterium sp. TaxID=191216 RepID=UPI0030FA4F70
MLNGIYVPVDESELLEQREFATLDGYQAAVGGWIETVDVPGLGITIYANEEGLLRRLPFNSRASFLWWYHVSGAQAMLVGNAARRVSVPRSRIAAERDARHPRCGTRGGRSEIWLTRTRSCLCGHSPPRQ